MSDDQPDLFDVGTRQSINDLDRRTGRPKARCIPMASGTGPDGETCRTCKHKAYQYGTSSDYLKCGLMKQHWTRGGATDIKASWPACGRWDRTA